MVKYSILIPVNIDSEERGNNLRFVVNHLQMRLRDMEIIVGEMGDKQRVQNYIDTSKIRYFFLQHPENLFHKSLLLNTMARLVDPQSNILVIHSADILLMPESYILSCKYMENEKYDVVYPYAYYNASESLNLQDNELDPTMDNIRQILSRTQPSRVSGKWEGIVFIDKDVFWESGAENEYIIGHSHEDLERYYRLSILEYRIRRIPGEAYHLYHPKTLNLQFENNAKEYSYTASRKKKDMKDYIRTWPWACGLSYLSKSKNGHKRIKRDKDRLQNIGDVDDE